MARFDFYGTVVVDGQRWFFAAPFGLDGTRLAQHAVVVRIPVPPQHYVSAFTYSSLNRRYFVLDVRCGETPPEIGGWGDPLVQRLIVDLTRRRVITPPVRSPRYIKPVAWSPSERYLLYRVARNVPAWQVDAVGAYVERAEKTLRLLDLQTNRELPLPKEIAHAGGVGFFAEQPDTLWALPCDVAEGYDDLNASFSLVPARAPKPPAMPSTRWIYQVQLRRLEQMNAAQYSALQENWDYLRWQLGGEWIGRFGGSSLYAQVLAPLRNTILASGRLQPLAERLSASVLHVGKRALLLKVESTPAPTYEGETFRPLLHYYLVERVRPEAPRLVGMGAFHQVRLVEGAGGIWLVVAGRLDGRLFVLDGKQGYIDQVNPNDTSLQARGVVAQWRWVDLRRQIRVWLQQQGISSTDDGILIEGESR